MAAPMVSGAIAILLEKFPDISVNEVNVAFSVFKEEYYNAPYLDIPVLINYFKDKYGIASE